MRWTQLARPLGVAVFVALLLSACGPSTPPAGSGIDYSPDENVKWWAMGDSVFSGVEGYYSPAAYIEETYTAARAGNTLNRVTLNGNPQATLRDHIEHMVSRFGVPERVVIHAGGADILVKSAHAAGATSVTAESIVAEALAVDDYLRDIGVQDVRWLTIIPTTSWGAIAPLNSMRRAVNDLLPQAFPGRLINCESVLLGTGSQWLNEDFQIYDGVHLNNQGARVLAECMATELGLVYSPQGRGNPAP